MTAGSIVPRGISRPPPGLPFLFASRIAFPSLICYAEDMKKPGGISMKKLRPFLLLLLMLLMLTPAHATDGMVPCSVPDSIAQLWTLPRLSDGSDAAFDYEVPEDGVAMVLLYSSKCNYSARVLRELSASPWLADPRVSITAVDCMTDDPTAAQSFVDKNLGGSAGAVSLWLDGYSMMWDYVRALTGRNSVSFPMVMLIDSTRTVRYYSMQYQTQSVFDTCITALLEEEYPEPPPSTGTFTYTVNNGCATITGVTDYEADLVVPASIDGYPVTTIGPNAFDLKRELETVVISEGITTIYSQAFRDCENLRWVDLPSTITYIYGNAFFSSEHLEHIEAAPGGDYLKSIDGVLFTDGGKTLLCYPPAKEGAHYVVPEGVTTIAQRALSDCTFTDLTLPASLEDFRKNSIYLCQDLQNFHVASGNPNLTAVDGLLYSADMTACLACPSGREGAVTVAEGVTELADYSFQNCGFMTSLTMPDTVTRIGVSAFEQCLALRHIDLSDSLTEIDSMAFYFCMKLSTLVLPASLERIGSSAFEQTDLTEYFFRGDAPALTGNTVPMYSSAKLYRIPGTSGWEDSPWNSRSFLDWDGVHLPEVSGIAYHNGGSDAWRLDRNTGTLYFNGITLKNLSQYYSGGWGDHIGWIKRIVTGDSVTILDSACLSQYGPLDSLHISASVDVITDTVFNSCPPIRTITVDENSSRFYTQDGMLLTQDHYLLYAGTMEGLTSYDVPDQVRGIGHFAFLNTKLESLTLPAGLDSSFMGLRLPTLKHISIPDSKRYRVLDDVLYSHDFNEVIFCPNGKTGTVVLPDHVRAIAVYAFQYSSLSEVVIPEGCSTIRRYAFYGSALEQLHIPGSVTELQEHIFDSCAHLKTVTMGDGPTTMKQSIFSNCTALEKAILPDTLTSMGRSVFSGCASLREVDLGDGLTLLPAFTFQDCTSLTSVTLPLPVIEIEDDAFQDCDNLRAIYAPGTSPAATSYAFRDCDSLPTVYHTPGHPGWQFPLGDWLGCPLEDWTLPERAEAARTDDGLVLEFSGVGAASSVLVSFYDGNGRMVSCREVPMEHGVLDPIPLPRNAQSAAVFFLGADCAPLREPLCA